MAKEDYRPLTKDVEEASHTIRTHVDIEDGTKLVDVHFDHRNKCYRGEDVPSNYKAYTYRVEE